ncbi:MAG TPA: transketolase [bacterium]|nr:transketolase [bacterium]
MPSTRSHAAIPLDRGAAQIRRDVIVQTVVAASGHPGGALGAAEILATLYFRELRHDPAAPDWPDRDRFVLSNGHLCAGLYSALARTGYFPPAELLTFRRIGSRLQGHPSHVDLPGVETSGGPLGQGLSVANGIALGVRLKRMPARVYCLVGDGELQEGQIWEAAMTAAHYRLDHVCLIVNDNGLQIDGATSLVKRVDPIAPRFQAFGWRVQEIDGHDLDAIAGAFERFHETRGLPTAIIAKTVMGRGVSFMEGDAKWHGTAPSEDQAVRALRELPPGFAADLWDGAPA